MMNILYALILITPIIPKVKLFDGIYVYLAELALFVYVLILLYRAKIPAVLYKVKASRVLLYFWLLIGLFTLINLPLYPNISDAFRNIKQLVYIPIIYVGYKFHHRVLRDMLRAGVISVVVNSAYYLLFSFPLYGFNIWEPKAIFSGMSNKYLDLANMSIQLIKKGAHGIYGDYLVLLMAIVLYLYAMRKLSFFCSLSLISIFSFLVFLTVSRASLITFATFWVFCGFWYLPRKAHRIKLLAYTMIIFLCIFPFIVYSLDIADNLPLFQKVTYTIESYMQRGSEGNISFRLGGWFSAALGLVSNPLRIVVGCGLNFRCIADYMQATALEHNISTFAPLPESLIMYALQFGGIFGLILMVIFLREIIYLGLKTKPSTYYSIFGLLFLAMVPANVFSGAPLISDLLYSQVLLIVGFLARRKIQQRNGIDQYDLAC